MYMNIGVVNPIQLFVRKNIPGTIKITNDAYRGWRQHLKIPSVTSLSALYARLIVFRDIKKNGTPTAINAIPRIGRSQFGTRPIVKTG